MPFNINEFSAAVAGYNEFASPNKFAVQMFPKWADSAEDKEILKDLVFFAYGAQFPGVTLDTERVRTAGYGPLEQRPRGVINDPVQVNFYADDSGFVTEMFHNWMNRIVYFSDPSLRKENQGQYSYDVAYAKGAASYLCNINITLFKNTQAQRGQISSRGLDTPAESLNSGYKESLQCILYDAFPIIVGDQQLSWESNDEVMRLPVSFAYRTHKTFKVTGREVVIDNLLANETRPSRLPPEIGRVIDTVADYGRPGSVNAGRQHALFESLAGSAGARLRDILIPARVNNTIRNAQAISTIF